MWGGRQVKPHPSGFEWQKHDGRTVCCSALKLLDDPSPLLLAHGAIQTHKSETMLSGEEEDNYYADVRSLDLQKILNLDSERRYYLSGFSRMVRKRVNWETTKHLMLLSSHRSLSRFPISACTCRDKKQTWNNRAIRRQHTMSIFHCWKKDIKEIKDSETRIRESKKYQCKKSY